MPKLPRIRSRHSLFASTQRNHVDVFMERYDRLRVWALRLTEDAQQADDILHDSFLQFTLSNADLGRVENMDAYLHGIVRNVYISAVRRAASGAMQRRSVVEFDSAELGYCLIDPSLRIQAREELRIICNYACTRKETSTAGSVLILRFFHGYYPAEIARIVRCTRQAVANRLLVARSEAKLELAKAATHSGLQETVMLGGKSRQEFLAELRESILQSRVGPCPDKDALDAAYSPKNTGPISCEMLAHVVSCRKCLDEVNRRLRLPLLSERHPNDTIGPDTGAGGDTGTSGNNADHLRRCAREVFEHIPRELSVAVNGHPMGSQPVTELGAEQSLNIALQETVTFVEVFSELGVRLLMMDVAEPSQTGSMEQTATTCLSDGRTLAVKLDQGGCWPKLQIAYRAPELEEPAEVSEKVAAVDWQPVRRRIASLPGRVWQGVSGWGYWLPAATTVGMIAILLIALVSLNIPSRSDSAERLLNESESFENRAILPEHVAFQTVNFVEQKTGSGEVIASRKIETWKRVQPPAVARRVYDEKGKLVAGEWTDADGATVVYQRNKMRLMPLSSPHIVSAAMMSEVPLTARDFLKLVGSSGSLSVHENPQTFVVQYRNDARAATPCITKASLTLRRVDLHPIEQSVTVKAEHGAREYHYVETKYVQQPAASVNPAVFHPDSSLFMPALPLRMLSKPAVPTPALIVDMLQRLDAVHALAGEQITLQNEPSGSLTVTGIVDTERRKNEILQSIGSLQHQPGIQVNIETAEEAQMHTPVLKGTPIELQGMDVVEHDIPISGELQSYFASHGVSGTETASQVQHLTSAVTGASMQARLDAMALNELVGRFSDQQLAAMPQQTREELSEMIRNHAQDFLARAHMIREDLAPIFPTVASATDAGDESAGVNLRNNVGRLLQLASATDDAVGRSFRITVGDKQTVTVNTAEFWRTLHRAEQLAAAVLKSSEQ